MWLFYDCEYGSFIFVWLFNHYFLLQQYLKCSLQLAVTYIHTSPVPIQVWGLAGFPNCGCVASSVWGTRYSKSHCWLGGWGSIMLLLQWGLGLWSYPCSHPWHLHPSLPQDTYQLLLQNLIKDWLGIVWSRKTCSDYLVLLWGSCSIMFQLKFGAFTLPSMQSKRTLWERLGGLTDFSLRELVK